MNGPIVLGWDVVASAAFLFLLASALAHLLGLRNARSVLWPAVRMTIQLGFLGLILTRLFQEYSAWLTYAWGTLMLLVAAREILQRQSLKLGGGRSLFPFGALALGLPAFFTTWICVGLMVQAEPIFNPRQFIPILGMVLGNTLNAVAISFDALLQETRHSQGIIETRLCLGWNWHDSIRDLQQRAAARGLVPMINAMAAAGIISLPGMMTGQILSGVEPVTAVQYQLMIMFVITVSTLLGTAIGTRLLARALFDKRERLLLPEMRG